MLFLDPVVFRAGELLQNIVQVEVGEGCQLFDSYDGHFLVAQFLSFLDQIVVNLPGADEYLSDLFRLVEFLRVLFRVDGVESR